MLTQRTANLIFVLFITLACGYFAWVAEGFITSGLLASSGLPSKFFPQLLLSLTAICAVIVGVLYLHRGDAGDAGETVIENGAEARRGLLMLVVAIACYFIWREIGFLTMAILIGPASLLAMGISKPMMYFVVLMITAVVTTVFTYGLRIQLI